VSLRPATLAACGCLVLLASGCGEASSRTAGTARQPSTATAARTGAPPAAPSASVQSSPARTAASRPPLSKAALVSSADAICRRLGASGPFGGAPGAARRAAGVETALARDLGALVAPRPLERVFARVVTAHAALARDLARLGTAAGGGAAGPGPLERRVEKLAGGVRVLSFVLGMRDCTRIL
jgi:hypothetical protein